jgi:phosphate transport system permease protein
MILPILMRTTEEAIRAVPDSFRQASFALSATRWQTIRGVVLRAAMPRILTGVILSVGRAFGETAAVIYTAGLALNIPIFPSESGRTMTTHLYLLATEGVSLEAAYGTAVLLLAIIMVFNWTARRYFKKM